jgi:hypothetical protein
VCIKKKGTAAKEISFLVTQVQVSSAQGAKNMPVFKRNTVSALKIEDD